MIIQNFKRIFKKPDPEREAEFNREVNEYGLEKKDMPALIFSAYLVIIPIAAAVLLVFALVAFLLVGW